MGIVRLLATDGKIPLYWFVAGVTLKSNKSEPNTYYSETKSNDCASVETGENGKLSKCESNVISLFCKLIIL